MMKMMMKSKISKDVKNIFGTSISTSHWVRKIQIKTDPNIATIKSSITPQVWCSSSFSGGHFSSTSGLHLSTGLNS